MIIIVPIVTGFGAEGTIGLDLKLGFCAVSMTTQVRILIPLNERNYEMLMDVNV